LNEGFDKGKGVYMIIEFVGMSGVGKSTIITNLKPKVRESQNQISGEKQSLSTIMFIWKLVIFMCKANLILKPNDIKARLKMNERLLLSCLKHYKNYSRVESIKIIDEGIVHAILFSLDNRVKDKAVHYEDLLHSVRFLLNLEELVVVFVDANEELIVENRQKRNRTHNEKTKNLTFVQQERSRNDRKLFALKNSHDLLHFIYINNSREVSKEYEIKSLFIRIVSKQFQQE
jgi:dephospho-CoA kinase